MAWLLYPSKAMDERKHEEEEYGMEDEEARYYEGVEPLVEPHPVIDPAEYNSVEFEMPDESVIRQSMEDSRGWFEFEATMAYVRPSEGALAPPIMFSHADIALVGQSPMMDFKWMLKFAMDATNPVQMRNVIDNRTFRDVLGAMHPQKRLEMLQCWTERLAQIIFSRCSDALYIWDRVSFLTEEDKVGSMPLRVGSYPSLLAYFKSHPTKWAFRTWLAFVRPIPFVMKEYLIHQLFQLLLRRIIRKAPTIIDDDGMSKVDLSSSEWTCKWFAQQSSLVVSSLLVAPMIRGEPVSTHRQLTVDGLRNPRFDWPDLFALPVSAAAPFKCSYEEDPEEPYGLLLDLFGNEFAEPEKDFVHLHIRQGWDEPIRDVDREMGQLALNALSQRKNLPDDILGVVAGFAVGPTGFTYPSSVVTPMRAMKAERAQLEQQRRGRALATNDDDGRPKTRPRLQARMRAAALLLDVTHTNAQGIVVDRSNRVEPAGSRIEEIATKECSVWNEHNSGCNKVAVEKKKGNVRVFFCGCKRVRVSGMIVIH